MCQGNVAAVRAGVLMMIQILALLCCDGGAAPVLVCPVTSHIDDDPGGGSPSLTRLQHSGGQLPAIQIGEERLNQY